jgi:hypothetical protein
MSITTPGVQHPLLAAVRACGESLDEVAELDPLYAPVGDQQALLVELTRLTARVTALRARVLAVGGDLAAASGARDAAAWLTVQTRTSRREAGHDQWLGVALRDRWPAVGDAVAGGRVTWEQAAVLVQSLDELPGDLDPEFDAELRGKAEAHLVGEAGHFDPKALRRLGRGLLQVIAPDLADAHEERALLAEEARARAATRLSFRPRGDGTTDLSARLPEAVASRLRVYLDAYTSPRRLALDSDVDQLPLPRRRGEAFCALLEHIPADRLPSHGGTATTVMVTLDLDTLRTGLGLAQTSTGEVVTAAEARRLACTAGIVPVVLDGTSEVLDLGRTRRLFSPAQRKALALRDRHCRAEGCDIPAAWCEAHHAREPWSRGGRTDLADGLLLCPFHHHRAHHPDWRPDRMPDGRIRFNRRT